MSTHYKHFDTVPSAVLAKRLDELSDAVGKTGEDRDRELTRRVPAELDRDADLVLSQSAKRLRDLESERDDWHQAASDLSADLTYFGQQHAAMAAFISDAIAACFEGGDLDGAWIQERCTELGLLEEQAFDPETHTTDCELFEPGDPIYVAPTWLTNAAAREGEV